MAKKLITDYEIVPASDIVKVKGKWKAEQLLLITNVDSNAIIYNFASSGSGQTAISYDADTDFTSFTLEQSLAALTTSTKLQVFVDDEYQVVDFPDSFYDPVNKLRVSTPENLIDTDFEYGLQSSKWETLELVNNIPSYHSTSGDSSISDIISVTSVRNSDLITVTTYEPHRLTIGTPIDVRGLSSVTAEGNFLITDVPSTTTFIYKAVSQNATTDISGVYTSIIAGRFFSGSALDYDKETGITTDAATPSKLTVTTAYAHGFVPNTEIYLINTVGTKKASITNTTGNASDGRPFVDHEETVSTDLTSSLVLSETETKGVKGTWSLKFAESAVNYSTNRITWNTHRLITNDCVMYMAPMGAEEIGGLNRWDVYYVIRVSDTEIQLSASHGGAAITLSAGGDWSLGKHQLMFCWEVLGMNNAAGSTLPEWSTPFSVNGTGSGRDLVQGGSKSVAYGSVLGDLQPQHTLMVVRDGFTPTNSALADPYAYFTNNANHKFPMLSADSSTDTRYASNPIENPDRVYGGFYNGFSSETGYSRFGYYYGGTLASGKLLTSRMGYFDYTLANSYSFTAAKVYCVPLNKDPEGNSIYVTNHGLDADSTINITATQAQGTTGSGYYQSLYNAVINNISGTDVDIEVLSSTRLSLKNSNLHSINGVTNLSAAVANPTANTIFYASHNFVTNQEVQIGTENAGVLPTVSSGQILYLGQDDAFKAVHSESKAIIEAWQTANPSKTTSFPVNDPINVQTSPQTNWGGASWNSNSNTWFYSSSVGGFYFNNSQYFKFGNYTDGQVYNFHSPTGGKWISENLDTFGATVPYALRIIGFDPTTTSRGAWGKEFTNYLYGDGTTNSAYYVASVNALTNGVRHTGYCQYTSPSATEDGVAIISINAQLDSWDTDPAYASAFTGNYSDYGTYTRVLATGNRSYDSSIWIQFYLRVPVGQSISLAEYQALHDSFVTMFQNNLIYPTLSSGPVYLDVVDNNRVRTKNSSSGLTHNYTSSGTPDITLTTTEVGALDGTYTIGSVPSATTYELNAPFEIPDRTISFADTNVNTTTDIITLSSHNLQNGTKIAYTTGTGTITGLTTATDYYAIVLNNNEIKVAASVTDAIQGNEINLTGTTAGSLSFTVDSVACRTEQTGVVSVTSGSKIITGDADSLFKRYWKIGDEVIILNNLVTPNTYITRIIDVIPTDGEIHLTQEVDFTSASTSIYRDTELFVRPNGSFQHRPFDGGVEIQTGTSPNSSIARQTRKYFRYQSGKGIQTSYAMNFNPPVLAQSVTGSGNTATVTTRYPHRLILSQSIEVVGSENADYNGNWTVASVVDDFTFTYTTTSNTLTPLPDGFINIYVNSFVDSYVRGGMFDTQNGFFFEYDGTDLWCCRRSSTQQLSGTASVTKGSHSVTGSNTNYLGQLATGDMVVIRGQSYKVTSVANNTSFTIQPAFRGVDAQGAIVTQTTDTKVRQSDWNIDTCDGNGKSGFLLDLKKIQMAYMDYSWYGAGKIRYGFKDTYGHVIYVHEFIHNNRLIESYFRSGNLPARYEVGTLNNPTYTPSLFHWGTSVMMDGRFDDDKAYLFTGNSNNLIFTNSNAITATTTDASFLSSVYNWSKRNYDWYVNIPFATSDASKLTTGTQLYTSGGELTGEKIDSVNYQTVNGTLRVCARIYIRTSYGTPPSSIYPSVPAATSVSIGAEASGTSSVDLGNDLIPIISIRLAPSVDGSLVGALGQRDIINRMHLKLNQVGMVLSHDSEVSLILNSDLSSSNFESVGSPSLCQLIKHEVGDQVIGGSNLYQFRASGGSPDSSGQNSTVTSNFELGDIIDLGNSILGGDGVFPNGPDLLTIAVKLLDTSGVDATNKYIASGRISWAESQA